jgi:hypothetical protein
MGSFVETPIGKLRQQQQQRQMLLLLGFVVLVSIEPIMGFFTSSPISTTMFDVSFNHKNKASIVVLWQNRMDTTIANNNNYYNYTNNRWKTNKGWKAIPGVQRQLQRRQHNSKVETGSSHFIHGLDRRNSIMTLLWSGLAIEPLMAAAATVIDVTPTTTAESSTTHPPSAKDILSRLGSIPTFVLVQGDTGIPFMIFNGERSATGYFFLSYNIAEQALRDARDKDQAKGSSTAVANTWDAAQVRVVPLSIAMQLTLSSKQRVAVNDDKNIQGREFAARRAPWYSFTALTKVLCSIFHSTPPPAPASNY